MVTGIKIHKSFNKMHAGAYVHMLISMIFHNRQYYKGIIHICMYVHVHDLLVHRHCKRARNIYLPSAIVQEKHEMIKMDLGLICIFSLPFYSYNTN